MGLVERNQNLLDEMMKRCKICVMPDTRPDTQFVDGVCSACIAYSRREQVDWEGRYQELADLVHSRRRRGAEYDCIVPSSGGKDSTAQVMALLELGVRPLVVTATTCMLTGVGRRNIDNLARHATTIEVGPNKTTRAILNRAGLELVGDISWPEHVAIFTTPFKIAVQMGIPLIFYGENPQNQYGGPLDSQGAKTMTRRWVAEFGGFLGLRPADLIGQYGISERDMLDYMPPDATEVDRVGVEAHFLGQYIPWDSHANADKARAAGFFWDVIPSQANFWLHENLDNAMTGIHDHMMYRKYGYGRGCAQAAVDVRSGRITRREAMAWADGQDGLFPFKYMDVSYSNVLHHIGVSEDDFQIHLKRFTNYSLFAGERAWRPLLKAYDGA